jgi:SAM-dependent methyltransferase
MAINIISLAWLDRLAAGGVLRGGALLDLGPQDLIGCPRRVVEAYAARRLPPAVVAPAIAELFDGETFRRSGIAAFYRLLGFERYVASDLFDPRATWRIDLNDPAPPTEQFDAVTNFGTLEHIFDIAAAFRFIHDTLRVGGVALHAVPVFGDVNHGFYNIHPTVFFDLARANGYAIEDCAYIDNIDLREALQHQAPDRPFDFAALPIKAADLATRGLHRKIADQYVAMATRYPVTVNGAPGRAYAKDYAFVALRKRADAPFRKPFQDAYAQTQDGRFTPTR